VSFEESVDQQSRQPQSTLLHIGRRVHTPTNSPKSLVTKTRTSNQLTEGLAECRPKPERRSAAPSLMSSLASTRFTCTSGQVQWISGIWRGYSNNENSSTASPSRRGHRRRSRRSRLLLSRLWYVYLQSCGATLGIRMRPAFSWFSELSCDLVWAKATDAG
jgi:hypothetical protein